MKTYNAPWGKSLIWSSVVFTVICVGVSIFGANAHGFGVLPKLSILRNLLYLLPVIVLLGSLLFVVRSYTIAEDAILVRRLLWTTRLSRTGLISAEMMPNAMRGSLRTCGNGGGFSYTGWYWNKSLGNYQAFVTDQYRTVVLRFSGRITVIVSPDEPEEFAKNLNL